jgi:hypothetical protein
VVLTSKPRARARWAGPGKLLGRARARWAGPGKLLGRPGLVYLVRTTGHNYWFGAAVRIFRDPRHLNEAGTLFQSAICYTPEREGLVKTGKGEGRGEFKKGLTNLIHIALRGVLGDVNASLQEGSAGLSWKTSYLQASGQGGLHMLSSKAYGLIGVAQKSSTRTVRFSRTVRLDLGNLRETTLALFRHGPSGGPNNSGLCQLRLAWPALGEQRHATPSPKTVSCDFQSGSAACKCTNGGFWILLCRPLEFRRSRCDHCSATWSSSHLQGLALPFFQHRVFSSKSPQFQQLDVNS